MSQPEPGSYPPAIPVPAQQLIYSTPFSYRRPGIITAIGVMAIVVGCLSVLSSVGSGFTAWGFLLMARVTSTMRIPAPATVAPPAPPAAPLTPGEVGVAVNTLSPMLALDGPHENELDHMIRLHGREIFGGNEDTTLTGAQVRQDVTLTRKMPSQGTRAARFVTNAGKVDIYADHAVFTAADGTTILDTSAKHHTDTSRATHQVTTRMRVTTVGPGGVSVRSSSTTLTPAQVNSVVSAVKSSAMSPLSAAQIQSLRSELSKPNQILVTTGNATPVVSVVVQPTGNVQMWFDTGNMLVLGPAGQVVSSGPPPMPKFHVDASLATLVIVEGVLSAALAIYLIVVGVVVLRGSFAGARLLRIYAWIKIPLAILAGLGVGTLMYQFYSGMSSMPGFAAASASSFAPMGIGYGIVLGALGLAFPIGVLIALRSRTVRGYFNAIVAGG
jgi:hypothetical protein